MSLTTLHHGIHCVDTHYLGLEIAAAYLLVHAGKVCVIETGTSRSAPHILAAIESLGKQAEDVAYIIPTHIHLDHAGGAGALMAACPNAQLVIHPRGAAHMIDPERLIQGTIAVYGKTKFEKLYGEIVPIAAERIIEAADGYLLDIGDRVLEFIDSPGHALHHFCVSDPFSSGVFTGDTFGIAYPGLTTPQGPFIFATTTPTQFDPDALLDSIDRVMSRQPAYLYLTHFGQVEATPELIARLRQSVRDHARLAREFIGLPEDRENRLRDTLSNLFVEKLLALGGRKGTDFYRQQTAADARLNAQGLDVWLKRLEKAA